MSADLSKSYDLVESDDPSALAKFALQWSDLRKWKHRWSSKIGT